MQESAEAVMDRLGVFGNRSADFNGLAWSSDVFRFLRISADKFTYLPTGI